MNRRSFMRSVTGSAGAALAARAVQSSSQHRVEKMRRIGMNTIIFRMRFQSTRVDGHPPITDRYSRVCSPPVSVCDTPVKPQLTLFDIPEYYADRFGIHNLEFWSRHFEVHSPGYLSDLKRAIARAHSKLIDIQLDDAPFSGGNSEFPDRKSPHDQEPHLRGYFPASSDKDLRRKSVQFVKEWLDAAAFLGSEALRVNTEDGDFNLCVQSFREFSVYGAAKGVVVMVENHGGISADPDLHVRLIKEVNHPNIRTSPDFGNHKPEIRYEALRKIMPYAYEAQPKALPFSESGEHVGYDFDRCMRIAVESGFAGVYSLDYWDKDAKPADYEKIADWLIEHTIEHV